MSEPAATEDISLTDAELDELAAFLDALTHPDALTIEGVDGMFSALIAGPDLVLPSEYLPAIWGAEDTPPPFASEAEANAILSLLMRHWNAIVHEFADSDVYLPLIDQDDVGENGVAGRDWAQGFMRGVRLRWDGWQALFTDENEGQILMIPVVAGEVDSGWPPKPLTPKAREDVLTDLIVGVGRAYRRFVRKVPPEPSSPPTFRRTSRKIGRNEPCPCGSGKKFKHCCGASDPAAPSFH